MATLQELINAGLPATSTDGGKNAEFSRPLTNAENLLFLSIVDVPRYKKARAKEDAALVISTFIQSVEDWNVYYAANLANGSVTGLNGVADIKLMLAKINTVLNDIARLAISLKNDAEL